MGLFGRSKTKETQIEANNNGIKWIPLTSIEQLNEIIETTFDKPVLLFKHSTRCSISTMAKTGLERKWSTGDDLCDAYYLDLLNHRDVSNQIEALTGITHQSPQAIVLKGRDIIYDATHNSIDARAIESTLKRS